MPSPPYCNRNPLVAVVGPTGAGKSELALRIAEHLDGEIVNCDSLQIYRGFDIGTAKLPLAERRGIPHHLIDSIDPTTIFSAGDYARAAKPILTEITARSRIPILVGGTGFYLRALLEGLPELPSQNPKLRERLAAWHPARLYRALQRLDPEAAHRLKTQDRTRTTRALEIRLLLGHPNPPAKPRPESEDYSVRKIALLPPREELYSYLNQRTQQMFRAGLIDEVRALLAAGIPKTAKPFEAVGYRQALAFIENRISLEQAIASTEQATRNYAKRQITWFRNDIGVEILSQFGPDIVEIPGLLTDALTEKKRKHSPSSSNTL